MTDLNDSSPFIRGMLSATANNDPVLSIFALAGLPSMGKPVTPYAARHMFTTRTSMDGVLREPPLGSLATVQVKEFVVARRRQVNNGMTIAT